MVRGLPINNFLMDKDAVEWAGLLTARKQQLAADKGLGIQGVDEAFDDVLSTITFSDGLYCCCGQAEACNQRRCG